MENASKALIIAGAILISIILITAGVIVVRQTSSITDSNPTAEIEMQTFNEKFTKFEGTKVRGSEVNDMLKAVLANNVAVDDADKRVAVTGAVTLAATATQMPATKANIGATYTVACVYGTGARAGLVISITVTKNTNT